MKTEKRDDIAIRQDACHGNNNTVSINVTMTITVTIYKSDNKYG